MCLSEGQFPWMTEWVLKAHCLSNKIVSFVFCLRNAIVSSALKQNILRKEQRKYKQTTNSVVYRKTSRQIPRRKNLGKLGICRNDETPENWSESRNGFHTA